MKSIILGLVLLLSIVGCYKDNGEPLRTVFDKPEQEVLDTIIASPPCESDLIDNSFSSYTERGYFTNPNGSNSGQFYSGGYAVNANGTSDYYFRIEFKSKPTEKRNFTTTNINNNRENECVIYSIHKITSERLYSENGKIVYVDLLSNGKLKVSFCDITLRHSVGSNSITINDFSVNLIN